jgi:peptidoglycan/LPS O-acetylase OafA/YrhL
VSKVLTHSRFSFKVRMKRSATPLPSGSRTNEGEPLLHTWSLAIEEQFYLLFPIFLLALLRLFPRPGRVLIGVGLALLALSVMLSTTHPQAAFYFSGSRAWELLLGAWLAATNVRDFGPRRFIPTLHGSERP